MPKFRNSPDKPEHSNVTQAAAAVEQEEEDLVVEGGRKDLGTSYLRLETCWIRILIWTLPSPGTQHSVQRSMKELEAAGPCFLRDERCRQDGR
eukprot:jgi/Chlat1/6450/Chrsp45S05956